MVRGEWRDGLGDDLPPDFATSVKEAGFGWPCFTSQPSGSAHPVPRRVGRRSDVLIQPHSAIGHYVL